RAAPREYLAPVGQGEGVEEFIDDVDYPPPGVRLDGGGAAERRAVPEGGALVIPPPEEPPGGGDRADRVIGRPRGIGEIIFRRRGDPLDLCLQVFPGDEGFGVAGPLPAPHGEDARFLRGG